MPPVWARVGELGVVAFNDDATAIALEALMSPWPY